MSVGNSRGCATLAFTTLVFALSHSYPATAVDTWLHTDDGCKFLAPFQGEPQRISFIWTGACVDGFVSGPGELSFGDRPFRYQGDFDKGRIVSGKLTIVAEVYEGEFKDNLPNGSGVLRLPDGGVLKARFVNGMPDGADVELTWPGGMRYRGQADTVSRQMSGKGVLEVGDGSVYEGEFKENRPEGVGVFTYPNGDVYRGSFVNGKLEGKGSILFSNQTRYEGEARAGLANGQGRMEFVTGDVYEGQFVTGKYHGEGKFRYASGDHYEGEFVSGMFHGTGTFTWKDGVQYTGQFLNGTRHGQGRKSSPTGEWQEGEWKNNQLNGKCHLEYSTFVYEGDCAGDRMSGRGRLTERDGVFYEGEFLDNTRHGRGVLRINDPEGTIIVYEGTFSRDVMDGPGTMSIGKVTLSGDFRANALQRGTITAANGRKFEIDLDAGEIVEVLKDGTKQPLDALPIDFDI
jgi:hypothetical protein